MLTENQQRYRREVSDYAAERREQVRELGREGLDPAEIAERVGYHRSTVVNELRRAGIPVKNSFTHAESRARRAKVRRLGRQGYSNDEISRQTGYSFEHISTILKRAGIQPVHVKLGQVSRRIDVNHALTQLILDATPPEITVGIVEGALEELDKSRLDEWDASLTNAIQPLTRLRRWIREMRKERDDDSRGDSRDDA